MHCIEALIVRDTFTLLAQATHSHSNEVSEFILEKSLPIGRTFELLRSDRMLEIDFWEQ